MSLRFFVVELLSFLVCLLGWQVGEKIPAPVKAIVTLVWCSLLTDLACNFAYQEGSAYLTEQHQSFAYQPLQHLYTVIEFLLEAQFVSSVTNSARLRNTMSLLMPAFFAAWLGFHASKPAMALGDEPLIILSDITMNWCIAFVLNSQMQNVSKELRESDNYSVAILFRETFRQIWLSASGKIFIGLFCYNFLGLLIFAYQLLLPESDTRYAHSASHLIKNTCIFLAFLEYLPWKTLWKQFLSRLQQFLSRLLP